MSSRYVERAHPRVGRQGENDRARAPVEPLGAERAVDGVLGPFAERVVAAGVARGDASDERALGRVEFELGHLDVRVRVRRVLDLGRREAQVGERPVLPDLERRRQVLRHLRHLWDVEALLRPGALARPLARPLSWSLSLALPEHTTSFALVRLD